MNCDLKNDFCSYILVTNRYVGMLAMQLAVFSSQQIYLKTKNLYQGERIDGNNATNCRKVPKF